MVIGAVLVIFMQAGCALVETGSAGPSTRRAWSARTFAIFGLAFIGFFPVGFPLSLSALDVTGYFGGIGAPAVMDTTAIIPTGAMAERWKWAASSSGGFCGRSTTRCSRPRRGRWVAVEDLGHHGHGRRLRRLRRPRVVRAVGGIAAFARASMLGARIGK